MSSAIGRQITSYISKLMDIQTIRVKRVPSMDTLDNGISDLPWIVWHSRCYLQANGEILLLEEIEMYGASNWKEVAEHVQCRKHYTDAYLNFPCFPFPDMPHLAGKNREELLAMAADQGRKGFPTREELPVNEEPTFSRSGIKIKESGLGQSPSSITADTGVGSVNKASDGDHIKGESRVDGSIGLRKPIPFEEESSVAKLSGYNRKRNEFDLEYIDNAEKLIADLKFKDTDTEFDHQLKLEMLRIYNQRLDEREHRKKFVLEWDLLFPDSLMKVLSPEARVLYDHYKVFMSCHSKEDHETMMKTVLQTDEIPRKLIVLQDCAIL